MRRSLVFGWGLAGVFAAHTTAAGQFAADRAPPPFGGAPAAAPARPAGGFQPATPPGAVQPAVYQAPAGAQQPAPAEMPSALANHPWALKPEVGPWMICVKSYAGTTGDGAIPPLTLSQELAKFIRETYRTPAYLFEYVSEDRKAVMAARAAAQAAAAPFLQAVEEQKRIAEARGIPFVPPDTVVRVRRANYPEQYAVLIGGFRTDEEARKALDRIRTWQPPKDERLMDGANSAQRGADGKVVGQRTFLNPFGQAFVAPNPTIPRAAEKVPGIDPFVVKLNDGRPYSLLAARKPWTLSVKTFDAPIEVVSDNRDPKAMPRPGKNKPGEVLAATGDQAEEMAAKLRTMTDGAGRSLGLEGFVFHTRTGSMVTVGQFDGPTDPELLRTKRLLEGMAFNVQDEKRMQMFGQQRLFDLVIPVPVPRP